MAVMSSVEELTRTRPGDPALGQDEPKEAHLVQGKDKVVEAAVLGTPVEALCGKVFVPSRDRADREPDEQHDGPALRRPLRPRLGNVGVEAEVAELPVPGAHGYASL